MEQPMKERLAGAVILVALAVIVLPALFDGEGHREFSRVKVEMPEKPAIVFGQHFPALDQADGEAAGLTGTLVRRAPLKEPLRAAPPVGGKNPQQALWVVQAGVFSVRENADSLRGKLRKAGFDPVFSREAKNRRGEPVYFVRIGPHKSLGAAEKIAGNLKKKYDIPALVRAYGGSGG